MENTVLVTGATGVLGREVVRRLRGTGVPVRALTRRTAPPEDSEVTWFTGDLAAGTGLDAALDGVRTVVHCASDARHFKQDVPAMENLIAAAERAGVAHVVNISIVGVDRIPYPYYAVKLRGERMLAASGLGWTNLRATQFPELLNAAFGVLSRLPVVPVPSGTVCQPMDQGEVADRLVELALGAPAGRVPDLAGPRVYPVAGLARSWLRAAGRRRPVLAVRIPGRTGAAFRSGAHTAPDRAVGRRTWEQYLTDRVAR
ncbi:SDR family oxidoreductase [Kitasatospora sp. HPMI-4]|uniref:SDR family oxidoreductase n=1 Tax=Kitasatospora sp. HPMI-4 TaxID=3448443 RepID=UPI003F19B740